MDRNPFLPERRRPDRTNAIVATTLGFAVALAAWALAMQLDPSLMPDFLPALVEKALDLGSEAGR